MPAEKAYKNQNSHYPSIWTKKIDRNPNIAGNYRSSAVTGRQVS